jgi:diacylglycerol kinase family enzyme
MDCEAPGMSRPRVGVVVNARLRRRGRAIERALARLDERTRVVAAFETRGDASDVGQIVALLERADPDVLVAAGGDGTAALALRALFEAKQAERTALALLPLGTGNNAARSFGLHALRDGEAALARAIAAIEAGPRRAVDVGLLGDRPFLGSVAVGMDADVLALRNRIQRRLAGASGGYALYLGGALASLLRAHGGRARLTLDGVSQTREVFNLAVVNAPVYAGPLRFDGENDCADGLLDVHVVASGWEYFTEYPSAWLRYLSVRHGEKAAPSTLLRRAREIDVEFARPVPAEADGEEIAAAARFRFRVLPRAVRICVPG